MAAHARHSLPRWEVCVAPRLTQRVRLLVVTIHVITSVGMLGVTGALVAFQVTNGPQPATDLIGVCVLTPMAITAFATGLLLAGSWGWGRWRWITCKLQISAMLTVVGLANLVGLFDPVTVLVARVCALVALSAMVAVSMAKPWGRTGPPHTLSAPARTDRDRGQHSSLEP